MRRIPLTVIQDGRRLVECTACGQCCSYVGIGINAPSRPRWATDILWYLYHENVYVYVDGSGEWSLHFETRCRQLGADLRCGVYAQRPQICRGFDNRSCEVNDAEVPVLTFREPRGFLAWLRENKPRVYAKIAARFVPAALRPPTAAAATTQRSRARRVARRARIGR